MTNSCSSTTDPSVADPLPPEGLPEEPSDKLRPEIITFPHAQIDFFEKQPPLSECHYFSKKSLGAATEDGVSGKLGQPGRMVPLRMGSVAGRSMKKENKEQRNFNVN